MKSCGSSGVYNDNSSGDEAMQEASVASKLLFLAGGTFVITKKFLVAEYKAGGDVLPLMKGVKTILKLGKISTALNIGVVGADVITGNIHSSTLTDGAMIGVAAGVTVIAGPIVAGVVGITYGSIMLMGGQDALNDAFDGNWNQQLNHRINSIQF